MFNLDNHVPVVDNVPPLICLTKEELHREKVGWGSRPWRGTVMYGVEQQEERGQEGQEENGATST